MRKIVAFLLIYISSATALVVETKTDWPAGERTIKYNLGHQRGGFKATFAGQYLTLPGSEDLIFSPSLSWQTNRGRFSASLSGRQLVTSKANNWRIWQGSWDYPEVGLSLWGLGVLFPSGKRAQEWSCQYAQKVPWGNWGANAYLREAYINQWSLPNRESQPWQRLRGQELYVSGQGKSIKLGSIHGYYWEWNRKEELERGERTMLWTEALTPHWQLGPLSLAGKGRWQEAGYGSSQLRALSGELNFSLKGQLIPLTAIRVQRKRVQGSTPFLFDREWDKREVSLKSTFASLLGGWELFSRYDYLEQIWREFWLSSKIKLGPISADNRFHFAPGIRELVRTEGNYVLNLPQGRLNMQLDYNLAAKTWNNRGGQITYSVFTFRYQNRAGYSPQWSGIVKTSGVQLTGDWWEDTQTLKFTFRPNRGSFEVSYWPHQRWQLANSWKF